MASRLTTNQEIAGSTPAVVIIFFNFLNTLFNLKLKFRLYTQTVFSTKHAKNFGGFKVQPNVG